jgi:hypothetical protein
MLFLVTSCFSIGLPLLRVSLFKIKENASFIPS